MLLGDGDGSFASELRFDTEEVPRFVAVGDFDGDGAPDLAAAIPDSDNVSILMNQHRAILSLDIDIKPGGYPNSVNPRSNGVIPVAILGSESFSVADINVVTLQFGPGRTSPVHDLAGAFPYNAHLQDVNHDGFVDLIAHYHTRDAEIACGDDSATLTGETTSGQTIEGSDSMRTVGCRGGDRRVLK